MPNLEEYVRDELETLKSKLALGKGVWPDAGYIRDDSWKSMNDRRWLLEALLNRAGLG